MLFGKKQKKTVLLMHNGGRLGNQLWLMLGLYAYSLEKKRLFDPRCFFEYQEYFNIPIPSLWSRTLGKLFYFMENTLKVPEHIMRDLFYGPYTLWSEIFNLFKRNEVVFDTAHSSQMTFRIFLYKRHKTSLRLIKNIFYALIRKKEEYTPAHFQTRVPVLTMLPPTRADDPWEHKNLYTYGWHFRNPVGLITHRSAIKNFFTPKKRIVEKTEGMVAEARKKYKKIVGVHIRLGDVTQEFYDNDRIAYSEPEVFDILTNFVTFSGMNAKDICFFICSDGKIAESSFPGLNLIITKNNAVEDVWLLSLTDTIIGADSSFAILASYLGNKPFIVFKRGGIDWEYYQDKTGYFENKYVKRFIY